MEYNSGNGNSAYAIYFVCEESVIEEKLILSRQSCANEYWINETVSIKETMTNFFCLLQNLLTANYAKQLFYILTEIDNYFTVLRNVTK